MNQAFSIERVPFEQKHALKQLLELYTYDFTEFEPFEVDDDGLFGYDYFEKYWVEPERHPFFIKVNGKLAGFVLVRMLTSPDPDLPSTHSIAEFFIMKRYRRLGIGKAAAHQIFKMFPGLSIGKQHACHRLLACQHPRLHSQSLSRASRGWQSHTNIPFETIAKKAKGQRKSLGFY